MSVSGSSILLVLPWQPGEKVYTMATVRAGDETLQRARTSAAHVFLETMGSGQSIQAVFSGEPFQNCVHVQQMGAP